MTINIIDFDVGEHFIPALINGDYQQLTTEDCAVLNRFIERECIGRGHWAQPENSSAGFGRCEVTGLLSTLEIVTWVIMGDK